MDAAAPAWEEGSDPEAERALLAKIAAGGEARRQGVAALYRRFAGRLGRYFSAHRLSPAEADDLVQEVFVNVVRACGEFRAESRVDTWLWAIARNSLMSHFRRRRPETSLDEQDLDELAANDPRLQVHQAVPGQTADDCVAEGLARFREAFPERGEVLARLVLEEWSSEQIAKFLGRTPGATREYLSQCRKKLKPFIERCLELLNG